MQRDNPIVQPNDRCQYGKTSAGAEGFLSARSKNTLCRKTGAVPVILTAYPLVYCNVRAEKWMISPCESGNLNLDRRKSTERETAILCARISTQENG